jgi:tetratricopeptide (TPR) repeat protein
MTDFIFKLILLTSVLAGSFCGLAQAPASQQVVVASTGLEIENCFKERDYSQAAILIANLNPSNDLEKVQFEYFEAKLALKLDKTEKLVIAFNNNYPHSGYNSYLAVDLGDYFFNKGKHKNAITSYRKANYLEAEDHYKLGLSYFQIGNQDSARFFLNQIPPNHNLYAQTQYNLGVIDWNLNNKNRAVNYFGKALKSPEASFLATGYLARYAFEQKEYQKAQKLIGTILETSSRSSLFDLLVMRGLSSYYLGDYLYASTDLQRAWEMNRAGLTAESLYALAICYNKLKQGKLAISPLREVVKKGGDVRQDAAYQLGVWYIAQEDYNEAIALFQLAREGSNESISQQAHYQQAKCLIKVERYDEAISQLEDFRKTYPLIYKLEASELLTSAYFHTSDYERTLEFIESTNTFTQTTREIYQEVAFRKALLLFNDQQMKPAIAYFDKSLKNQVDEELVTLAKLYTAEAFCYLRNYSASIPYYLQIIGKTPKQDQFYQQALYGLAYAYYNEKQYSDALPYFDKLSKLQTQDRKITQEAMVRKADCLFVTKQYENASKSYKRLLKTPWAFYANFQLGKVYALMDQPVTAEEYLQSFEEIDSITLYRKEGLLLLGQIRTGLKKYVEAIRSFDLIINMPDKYLLDEALLGKGLAATNAGLFKEAEKSYKRLIDLFAESDYADDALLGLQTLTEKGFELTNFDQYLDVVSTSQPDNTSLNRIAFEQAKSFYFQQEYDQAIVSLSKFLADNSQSTFAQEAYYYLGDSYYRQTSWQESINSFDQYLSYGSAPFYIRVLDKQGKAALELSDINQARISFEALLKHARSDREIYQGRIGLLEVLEKEGRYDEVVFLADRLLQSTWKPVSAESDLSMIKSKAYLKLNDREKATDELIKVINGQENATNAEAQFQLAILQAEEGNLALSNETLLQLISNFGSYYHWKNKAYLQLIKNYQEQHNELQARATIMSILENSKDSILFEEASLILLDMDEKQALTIDTTQTSENE